MVKEWMVCLLLVAQQVTAWGQLAPETPVGIMAGQVTGSAPSPEPGLLFYLSGKKQFTADYAAGGQALPNYLRDVKLIPGGVSGAAFEADDKQLMSYWAPGNIFAQRGTVSFFWRSRYPVGTSPFPVFRVGYADHSSWDMVWLRIDYNGSGFDAFVTDIGLSRTRVSHFPDVLPKPDQWTHIALSWDETEGIRFYLNGKLVAQQSVTGNIYDTGLDQFGPHSRIISPYQVQSEYNFVRGGDMDELRIYDRMLSDDNITSLAKNQAPKAIPAVQRNLGNRRWRDEWWTRNGWNLPNEPPPLLTGAATTVRKVEIHDTYDVRRWHWKANDGIRETTWPGVYNMSRLPGRYDYFVLPDWDIYSVSGQSVKFQVPDEPWNQVEIWGKAWGQLTYEQEQSTDNTFAVRTRNQVRSTHRIGAVKQGGKLRFDNAVIEEPIGELGVYYVHDGQAPKEQASETFTLHRASATLNNKALQEVAAFIDGRYPADERMKMVGDLSAGNSVATPAPVTPNSLPFIHLMIPYTSHPNEGLDGVEISLPALAVAPTHQGVFPMNIRVKDPLWQMRDLADFSFSVKPREAHTLWIDTRNRVLPEGHALYITLSGAGRDLTPALLEGAKIRLVYTPKDSARPEHELDRITQVRDLYSHTVEEHPLSPRLNLFNRFMADDSDLLKVNPDNWLAKAYLYAETGNPKDRPAYKIAPRPADIPEWAFLQTEYLAQLEKIINFYIDNRQISNGEFGGGLSDDDDFTNMFPATAFMGIEPEKTLKSLRLLMTAFYNQDRDPYDAALRQRSLPLFTNGLATISTDLLHSYEEGIELLGQLELLDYGNPIYINRGMETAKRLLDDVTQVNAAGHRHFRSRFYGGTRIGTEDPWQWSAAHSYHMLHTSYMISRYNGNPRLRKMITDIADGLLAHADSSGKIYTEINFGTDKTRGLPGTQNTWQLFKAAYDYTGNPKYLKPIPERIDKSRVFNAKSLVQRYTEKITEFGVREYINTEGSIWIDRLTREFNDIQTDRLGGVAISRISNIYPQNYVSWKIDRPANYRSLAFFIPSATPDSMDILAYNLEREKTGADMTVWNIRPGRWRVVQGIDTNDDQQIDAESTTRTVDLESGESVKLVFAPRRNTMVKLQLVEPAKTGFAERPDVGVGPADIKIRNNEVTVRVSSLGSVDAPATTLELKDARGNRVATIPVPAMKAPLDLVPKWVDVKTTVPPGTDLTSGSVQLDPEHTIIQITRRNDEAKW